MNREGRAKLKRAAEKINRESRQAVVAFTHVLENLLEEEQEKLDNLLGQLACFIKGEQLEESLESIEALLSGAEDMEEILDSVVYDQGWFFLLSVVLGTDIID